MPKRINRINVKTAGLALLQLTVRKRKSFLRPLVACQSSPVPVRTVHCVSTVIREGDLEWLTFDGIIFTTKYHIMIIQTYVHTYDVDMTELNEFN